MAEEWRDIPGYAGYQASSLGRVRSLDREVAYASKNGLRFTRKRKGKVLSPCRHSDKHPYPYAQLGKGNSLGVHVAVCLAFHGERPPGCYACHLDGNPENNIPSNVYWGTPSQNQEDRKRHGTSNQGRGHKLTPEKIAEIRARLVDGCKQSSIAKEFGISQSMVSVIKSGKRWAA
ncbi:NUMOD4 domain-containing protein [Cobetia sp. SIMBA_158]|uniref:NUMOD4 domain-containing protein n=1 Tax=Cobetia sp. SIMBA_158 TaxID=3081617 RepID=UPI00398040DC